jgi:2-oxo-3-hexenedioate decarboxylase
MRALLARRSAELEAGAVAVGWKIGFNAKGIQEHFGLDGPVVGYLTDSTVLDANNTISLRGWHRPALEVEVAIRVGADGEVAALAPALELVDLLVPLNSLEPILADNIFHRGVVFGPEIAGLQIAGPEVGNLAVSVRGGSERLHADGELSEAPEATIGVVRAFLAAHGAALLPGDRIIAGSMITPLPIESGDEIEVTFGSLGRLTARFN